MARCLRSLLALHALLGVHAASGSLRGAQEPAPLNASDGLLGAELSASAHCTPTLGGGPSWHVNCLHAGPCCDPSATCFLKAPGLFAACMHSCTPGYHFWEPPQFWYPWSCQRVAPGSGSPGHNRAPPGTLPMGPSNGTLFTFYMYRAQNKHDYEPKDVNAANLPGVMWYLQHEVVTHRHHKFGIKRILRYKVQTKAPQRIVELNMNFGVRYAYDSRKCTGPGNCDREYANWGYFVGCNKLGDFPYPKFPTSYAGGVWYSLPSQGACDAPPTGAPDCTYSYEAAGEIGLDELERSAAPGPFWAEGNGNTKEGASSQVAAAQKLFAAKYPDLPEELPEPPCDFDLYKVRPHGIR